MILLTNFLYDKPTWLADLGIRLVDVNPGNVLISNKKYSLLSNKKSTLA